MTEGLRAAIRVAGNRSQLASMLGLSRQAVSRWYEIPIRQVLAVERATGIPREVLRPDLYRR